MRLAIKMIEKSTIDNDGSLILNRKKLSSEMVKIEVQKYLLDNSFFGPDIIIACGKQSADPHERGYGKLFANVPIVIDIFPRHEKTKYWGDMTRTICKGVPSNKLMKMYKAVKDAQKKRLIPSKKEYMDQIFIKTLLNVLIRLDLRRAHPMKFLQALFMELDMG